MPRRIGPRSIAFAASFAALRDLNGRLLLGTTSRRSIKPPHGSRATLGLATEDGVYFEEKPGHYFENVTGTKLRSVLYLGAAPLNQDLIARRVDLFLGMATATFPFVRAGQINAYAVIAKARSWPAPEIPTMEEEGVPGLFASFWHGLWAPKGTPSTIIARLKSAVRAALADPAVQKRYAGQGHHHPTGKVRKR